MLAWKDLKRLSDSVWTWWFLPLKGFPSKEIHSITSKPLSQVWNLVNKQKSECLFWWDRCMWVQFVFIEILIHTEGTEQEDNGQSSSSSSCFQLANNRTVYIREEMYLLCRPCWKSSISENTVNTDMSEQNPSIGHTEEMSLSSSRDQWQDCFPVEEQKLWTLRQRFFGRLAWLRVYASFNEVQPGPRTSPKTYAAPP